MSSHELGICKEDRIIKYENGKYIKRLTFDNNSHYEVLRMGKLISAHKKYSGALRAFEGVKKSA